MKKSNKKSKAAIKDRALALVVGIGASVAIPRALDKVHSFGFMAKKTPASPPAATAPGDSALTGLGDINFKRVGLDGAVSLAGAAIAMSQNNEYVRLLGIITAGAGVDHAIGDFQDPSQLGEIDAALNQHNYTYTPTLAGDDVQTVPMFI